MAYKKKLIEVALPLDKINAAAAYEKMPGIGAHPRGLHLWWARRPLTTARAVIWSSLIDDPSSHPELFPSEEEQKLERARLFKILEDLVDWKKSKNEDVIHAAQKELEKFYPNGLPTLLDPFAGGGAIPLEAHRLGLKAIAHDLDPVAVMINKAMIEIPGRFVGNLPVNPQYSDLLINEKKTEGLFGLSNDVKYYGKLVLQNVEKLVGKNYPIISKFQNNGVNELPVVAWLWTRVVKCPNPACGCQVPLIRSFTLAKKKGYTIWVELQYDENGNVSFIVQNSGSPKTEGTINKKGAFCPCCGSPVDFSYIYDEGKSRRMISKLMAIVANDKRSKLYLSPTNEQENAANIERPKEYPDAIMENNPRDLRTAKNGMNHFSELFTNRQLTSLVSFSNEIESIKTVIEQDAVKAGMKNDHIPLNQNGSGATAYAEAICVYLSFALDRLADFSTSVSRWAKTNEKAMNCFNKQAIVMTWDYPEVNIFGNAVGSFSQIVEYISDCILTIPNSLNIGISEQYDAQHDCGLRNIMISTDPPYYDNINYADLADFFYIWMRKTIKDIFPNLFETMMVPKTGELIASPFRHNGDIAEAKNFFEQGMLNTCKQLFKYSDDSIPVTIYYAYKQSETNEENKTYSSGWETMLNAIIQSGFSISGTWPMRTEQAYRSVSLGTNALASSIVLVCRKRPENAPQTTRRNLINALKRELRPALKKLKDSNIAPVDLAQSAIGPGMAVFSRYSQVLEADGSPMTVRSALQVINEEIDFYFNEQVGSLDTSSRFCVDIFTQCAYNDIKYGEAEVLANAKGASIPKMVNDGVLFAKAGNVHLIERSELPEKVNKNEQKIWLLTQQLTRAMEKGGIESCAEIVFDMQGSNTENAKDLAYRLFTISDRKKWAEEAYAYNALVVAWPDIQSRAAELMAMKPVQTSFFD